MLSQALFLPMTTSPIRRANGCEKGCYDRSLAVMTAQNQDGGSRFSTGLYQTVYGDGAAKRLRFTRLSPCKNKPGSTVQNLGSDFIGPVQDEGRIERTSHTTKNHTPLTSTTQSKRFQIPRHTHASGKREKERKENTKTLLYIT